MPEVAIDVRPADAPQREAAGPDRTNRVVAVAYAIATVVMTFPTSPARARTHIPGDSGDALLNLWILRWGGRHVDNGWHSIWNTSIFFPNADTLAYSESMLPVAIVHRVLTFVVRSDVLAFNLIYVAAWFASAYCTYLLARRLTGSVEGAFLAGLAYTFAVPRLAHYTHFQLAFGCLVPIVLLLTVRVFERPTPWRGLALGSSLGVLMLSTSYYGLMTVVALAVVVPGLLLWWHAQLRQTIVALAIGAACAVAIVAPVAYEYASLQRDPHFRREPEPAGAAHLGDFLRVTPDNYVLAEVGPLADRSDPEDGTVENRLFPGVVAIGLGIAGVIVLARTARARLSARPLETRALLLILAAGALVLLLSFGDRLTVAGTDIWMPYSALRKVTGFSGLRATSRFVAFPMLALALIGAVGFAGLTARVDRRARLAILAIVSMVVLAESAMTISLARVPDRAAATAVNEELARRPRAPVVELPVGSPSDGAAWAYTETPRQWLSVIDGNPRIGGYSGFDPKGYDQLAALLETFPSPEAIDRLRELGVRYVVLRTGLPGPLRDFQEAIVDVDGVGRYSEETAQAIVDALAPDDVARVEKVGSAWLIELAG